MNGATIAQSTSVRLAAYGMSSRASYARAAGTHMGGLSEASEHLWNAPEPPPLTPAPTASPAAGPTSGITTRSLIALIDMT